MLDFSISIWSGWAPGADSLAAEKPPGERQVNSISRDAKPDVSAVPPMLRRRLNQLGRACASEVLLLLPNEEVPLVYCSQHGDIERTLAVLLELAGDGGVSPNNFSLAVHNAICGVLSIHTKSTAAITTIAAGTDGLIPVLLEAVGLLSTSCPKVQCVLCDVPLPDVYQSEGSFPAQPFAVSFVVTTEECANSLMEDERTKPIPLSLSPSEMAIDSRPAVSPLDFCEFLSAESDLSVQLPHNSQLWELVKRAPHARNLSQRTSGHDKAMVSGD